MYFDEAFEKLMNLEGWAKIVDDPHDKGGKTKFGISQKAYPNLNITALSLEDAKKIYFKDYWQTTGVHRLIDKGLAIKIFCTVVLMGPFKAALFLQKAVNVLGGNLK